jgi:uncharacterized protein (TIGR02117 family)
MKSFLRNFLLCSLIVVVGIALFPLAAWIAALTPVLGRTQDIKPTDPPIFVCANFAHAEIIMPLTDVAIDWQSMFDIAEVKASHPELYLSFGWGDLAFFQQTGKWQDMRLGTTLAAFSGRLPTTLRMVVQKMPRNDPECLMLVIDVKGRRAMANHIRETLATSPPTLALGSEKYQRYYIANGQYGIFHTCNQWVSDGLGKAGLPHAWYSPFSFDVIWPLYKIPY